MMIINQTKPVSACPTHDMVDMDTVDLDMSDMDIADMDMVGNGHGHGHSGNRSIGPLLGSTCQVHLV